MIKFQCFTHRYLGWKIQVHDSCDSNASAAASEIRETFVDLEAEPGVDSDLKGGASIRVSTKVTPAPEFFKEHQEYGQAYGHRHFSHHSATNSNLGSHLKQLTRTHVPYDHRDTYERLQLPSYGNHGLKSTYNPSTLLNIPHPKDIRHTLSYSRLKEDSFPSSHFAVTQVTPESAIPPVAFAHPIMESEQEVLPSNQQSKLIPDSKPGTFMSFGPVKYPYPHQEAPPQTILFTRTPQHIFHQPPRTQLMILRRPPPPQMRRPIPMIAMNAPMMPMQSRPPVFIERKKSVYRNPSAKLKVSPQVTKLMKIEGKQRAKLEAKVSEIDPSPSVSASLLGPLKPARNTGFNPDSIVIEGGFKPILKNVESHSAQERNSDDDGARETSEFRSIDNFEPMFIPSPPDGKKIKKKTTTITQNRQKVRLDDLDDMEMAADRLDSYYMPSNSAKSDEISETLITFDGKRVKDSSLARSIPKSGERPRKKLNSDLLSRTPQFGRFRGDLPPSISGDVRNEDLAQLERRAVASSKEISVPELTSITHNNHRSGNTKLTLIERTRRSTNDEMNSSGHNHDRNGHTYDHTGYVQDHDDYVHHSEFDHSHDHRNLDHRSHDHSNHDHSNHDHSNHSDHNRHNHDHNDGSSTLASTGQVIIANIEYIVLTAILYYII